MPKYVFSGSSDEVIIIEGNSKDDPFVVLIEVQNDNETVKRLILSSEDCRVGWVSVKNGSVDDAVVADVVLLEGLLIDDRFRVVESAELVDAA